VIGHPVQERRTGHVSESRPFFIRRMDCLTGAGDGQATTARLFAGDSVRGVLNFEALATHLPQRVVRRLKRLPRMVLTLAAAAAGKDGPPPQSMYFGTGWGPLSEAYDFLMKLYASEEQFSSPTDFIGAVHNAPAGQAAIQLQITGPNITLSGGDYSFEQALFTASLFQQAPANPFLLIGADEHHPVFAPLLEPAAARDAAPADGGAAFLLTPCANEGLRIFPLFFAHAGPASQAIPDAIACLGGPERIRDRYAAIFFGIPAVYEVSGGLQWKEFLEAAGFGGPVVEYRRWTGEFCSASAVATFMAAQCIQRDEIPQPLCGREAYSPGRRGILLLNLGDFVTAVEVMP
jgi:3-oxoacyl-[acyl-carrier-protein] synthase-1/3-oxoacyl-[acyl-carrier-protein] synthase II